MIRLKDLLTESTIPSSIVSSTAANIANKLIQRGFNVAEAAVIVGNMWAESTLNPFALNSIGAFGLLQWLGPRKKELKKFAKNKGRKETDLNTQLDFIKYELKDRYNGTYSYEANMFNKAMTFGKTLSDKAEGFARFSERPGKSELTTSLTARRTAAHDIYAHLKDAQSKIVKKPIISPVVKGQTLYPLKTNTDPVNIRHMPTVNNGWINNIEASVPYPVPIGTLDFSQKGADGYIWYHVKTSSDVKKHFSDAPYYGWVRSDVVANHK
jgi:hypothetical protein